MMRTLLIPTPRTQVIDLLRSPFGGQWLGEPGWLTVDQIADGTGLSKTQVRNVLQSKCFESRGVGAVRALFRKATKVYRLRSVT